MKAVAASSVRRDCCFVATDVLDRPFRDLSDLHGQWLVSRLNSHAPRHFRRRLVLGKRRGGSRRYIFQTF